MAPISSANPNGGQTTAVPYALIPFLAIIGAACCVMLCWAIFRMAGEQHDGFEHFSDEQVNYMREVRRRNRQMIAEKFGFHFGGGSWGREVLSRDDSRTSRGMESVSRMTSRW